MALPGIQTLFFCLSWMFVGRVEAEPQYMAFIPAVIESGADTTFCVSLLRPGESLLINISLISRNTATLLLQTTSSQDFHTCVHFQAPSVQKNEVVDFKVEVKGATFHSEEIRKVKIRVSRPMTFIQTDKPIYLPGQTVHFRVVTLDTKLRPANQLYNVIEIQDSDHNRIRQWLNTTSSGKILQLSHSLNSEAREGTYRVTVWINGDKTDQHFKVEKYVLPKFDVEVKAKDEISIGQEKIRVDVCAKYTFGQSVPGTVELEMCRRGWLELPDSTTQCVKETKQTEKDGCTTFMVAMSTFTTIEPDALRNILHLSARVEEEGTGILLSREKTVSLSYFIGKLFFIDTPKVYNQGSILEAKVKAVHFNDTPIPDKLVYLVEFTGISEHDHVIQNLTTDSDGIATFTLDTTGHIGNIQLKATLQQNQERAHRTPRYQNGYHRLFSVQPSSPHSVSASSLKVTSRETPLVCDKGETISIHYTIVGETPGCVDVMYLILSRGAIVMQGLKTVEVRNSSVTEGEVSFTLNVSPEMAPHVQVVAYAVLPSETVMAHSADFPTEKCFSNKVSLEFSPSSAVPGEETTLTLTAQPNSLCGVSAVDQSVLIQEPGQTLDADKIFNLLPVKKGSSFQDDIEDPVRCLNVRQKGSVFPCCGRGRKSDAYFLFKNVGLKVATNLLIRRPLCEEYEYYRSMIQYRTATEGVTACSGLKFGVIPETEMVTVRTFFPETWIWDLVEVGESGTAAVSLTVPDTITTWETETFCLSSQGFGLAPRKQLTVFQPFFLELTLPYSVIRGEHFELKATVFNYLSSCIMVSVTATPSSDYTLTPLSGDLYTSCLCASERKTLSWTMIPSVIGVTNVTVTAEAVASHVSCDNEVVSVPDRGRIDVVTRPLIVKAEGTEETQTYNWLLCPKDQNCQSDCPALHAESLTEEIELQLPENVIDGSARASVSVLGDILGRALRNLDGLLKMPYGCGEQNIALLAPNIYILQYLKNTQQLTAAIEEKAFNFLTSGYQRQLGYEHLDGAYSTFGRGVGNTWLTAFVLRCFVKAQSFVYIDPAKIAHSKTWLESKQRENGCFELSGKLFNNRMKGGVSDEVTLSAYITAAFLEMNMSRTHHVVQRSLSCLSESISDLSNTYTTALLAYVFTLAGDMETRAHLLKHLDTVSSQQGGFLHWSQTAAETSASLSVEISSYVLLAKLSASPTAEDLSYSTRIVRWLTGQQNHYGGFSSTQDTVVALQALALYSTLVFSPEGSGSVTVQSPSGQLTFDVNRDNKLLYQEEALEEVTGRYSLEVTGTACAAVQIFLHYNIPTPDNFSNLHVVVVPSDDCSPQRHKFILFLQSVYTGKENSTNMVILDIKMLSGFVPDPESLKKLRSGPMVDRVDQNEDHVVVYLQELQKYSPIDHRLALIQEHPVQNLKPAVVKIYDYYQPSDQYETEYTDRCAAA